MSGDIATLGIAVNASQVTAATAALNQLAATGQPTTAALQKLTAAAVPAAQAHANLSTQSMAAFHAMRSMAEGAALGLPPFMILTQQLNHLSYAASGPGGIKGAFGDVLSLVRGMITPTVLLGGSVALLAGGAALAYHSWKGFALQLDDTSKIMGVTASEAAKLQAVAGFKGIDAKEFADAMKHVATNVYEVKAGIGGAAELFRANNIQVQTLNQYLDAAANLIQRSAGDTTKQFAILQQLGIPATMEWVRLLSGGAEGLKRAKDGAAEFGNEANDKMIAKAREFDDAWNRTWTNFGLSARAAVVEFFDAFKGAAFDLEAQIKSAETALKELEGRGGSIAAQGRRRARAELDRLLILQQQQTPVGPPLPPTAATSGPGAGTGNVTDPKITSAQLGLEQQRIGILGQMASALDANRQQEIAIILARQSGVRITKEEEAQLRANAEATSLGTMQIRQQADTLRIETEAMGLGTSAATAFKAVQEKIAEARRIGKPLEDAGIDALKKEAVVLGELTQASKLRTAELDASFAASQLGRTTSEQQVATTLRNIYGPEYQSHLEDAITGQLRLNSIMLDTKTIGESALSGLIRDLRDGKSATEAFKNVLIKLEDKLIDIASNQIMSGLLGKSGGQGLLSNLFGNGSTTGGAAPADINTFVGPTLNHSGYGPGDPSGPIRLVSAGVFANAPRFHSGVGPNERAAVIRKDESVLTPGQMRALGASRMGGQIIINPVINNRAADSVSATAETRQNPDGSVDIEVAIERVVNRTIASGRADKSLRRHGASPVTTRR